MEFTMETESSENLLCYNLPSESGVVRDLWGLPALRAWKWALALEPVAVKNNYDRINIHTEITIRTAGRVSC